MRIIGLYAFFVSCFYPYIRLLISTKEKIAEEPITKAYVTDKVI